jgi:DNA-binding response OmpR family regulator
MLEKILLANTDTGERERFYDIFSSSGYQITCVPNGKEALEALTESRFDLIVLDEDMDDISGSKTAKKIREFDSETTIVLLAQKNAQDSELEALKTPDIQAIVKKDFSNHLMMRKIFEILKQSKRGKAPATTEKPKATILVVDDNENIRLAISTFLEKQGYEAPYAASGEEALMEIKHKKPHIVLLDIRMPGMDGLVVLRQIKKISTDIKVIILTSAQDEQIMKEAEKLGASDYLVKPCDLEELDAVISSLLTMNNTKNG